MYLLVEHCRALLASQGSLFLALFAAGLLGSLTHCAGMCGPLVATQSITRMERLPAGQLREWRRLQGAALLPYHLGRIATYAALGALAGGFSSFLFTAPYVGWLGSAMLALAGALFLMQAFGVRSFFNAQHSPPALTRMTAPFWGNPTGLRGFALGTMLGFLPCGLVYAALMAVATTASASAGALGMLLFGMGTIPALFVIGLGSSYAAQRWPLPIRRVARGLLAFNGIVLCGLALEKFV